MSAPRSRRLAVLTAVCLFAAGCSGSDSSAPEPGRVDSIDARPPTYDDGDVLPPGEAHALVVGTHCGVRVLGRLVNGTAWITDEAPTTADWLPPAWSDAIADGQELIAVSILLSDDGTELVATAEDVSVSYRPVTDADDVPGCA